MTKLLTSATFLLAALALTSCGNPKNGAEGTQGTQQLGVETGINHMEDKTRQEGVFSNEIAAPLLKEVEKGLWGLYQSHDVDREKNPITYRWGFDKAKGQLILSKKCTYHITTRALYANLKVRYIYNPQTRGITLSGRSETTVTARLSANEAPNLSEAQRQLTCSFFTFSSATTLSPVGQTPLLQAFALPSHPQYELRGPWRAVTHLDR